jgi:hypothetical protein
VAITSTVPNRASAPPALEAQLGILRFATIPPGDIGIDHPRRNGSFCRGLNWTAESGSAAFRGGKGSEQILLAVRTGIGRSPALLRHRREGAHQLVASAVVELGGAGAGLVERN